MPGSIRSTVLATAWWITSIAVLGAGAVANAGELHTAARTGDLDSVNTLIESGADLNATDGEGETALHKAAKANKAGIIERLLDAGADPLISGMGPFGATGTPIHVAAKFNRIDSLKVLLAAGVDPNLSDPGVGTPLHLALRARRSEAAQVLRDAGAGPISAPPVNAKIATADPEDGRRVANTCQLCHQMGPEAGERKKAGPPLWNVVGRPKASVEGYAYSDQMAALDGTWSFEDLNSLVADVRAYIPGTKMDGVAGIRGDDRRAALLRYLRDLADTPIALPSE